MACAGAQGARNQAITVSFAGAASAKALDGRVLFLLSNDASAEPRMQINDTPKSQMVFGVTVDGLKPGRAVTIDDAASGYPVRRIEDVPEGDYTVQAVLNVYETFHRGDGTTVKLAPDRGEGQHWNLAPGNLYSAPKMVHIGRGAAPVNVVLDKTIPPIVPEADTKYVKHLKVQSELLTKFWGRPMFLSAIVLLPEGFDEHPNAHYPEMVFEGHFPEDVPDFRTTPPDANLKPDYSDRFHLAGYNKIQQDEAYAEYKKWISARISKSAGDPDSACESVL